VIGYGAWEAGGTDWGPNESDEAVTAAMRTAVDSGISWIDTAEVYGDGVSETLVGRALADGSDGVLVASKVAPLADGSGFRPEQVRRACEASLGRLGRDRIDLYQLHWPDETGVPVEDTWGAMGDLQDRGIVGAIGVSNFDRPLIERCEAIRHVDSLQQEFSLLRLDDRELIRWCGEAGTGVVAYGPLGFGLLTGAISRERAESLDDWRAAELRDGLFGPAGLDRAFAVIDGMRPIAADLGVELGQLALAWVWHQPGVTSAIAGSRNADHVRANAAAGHLALDETTLARIETLL
jgi:aryl-alcohol dehydrogenase-like predicted oxidoreductase